MYYYGGRVCNDVMGKSGMMIKRKGARRKVINGEISKTKKKKRKREASWSE
jgi:hypothetical protein